MSPRLIASAASAIAASTDETDDLCGRAAFARLVAATLGLTGLRGLPLATRSEASVFAANCSRSAIGRDFFFFFGPASVEVDAFFWVLEYKRLPGLCWLERGDGWEEVDG